MSDLTLSDGTTLDVAAYPLPDGIDDGVLNRGQLALAMRVSENTITSWIGDGMPVQREGSNGQAYEFLLSHCFAWKLQRDDLDKARRLRGDQLAQRVAQSFLNLDDDQADVAALSPQETKQRAEADYHRNRAAELRGELVRADRVRQMLDGLLVDVRTSINVLTDFAEQEFGLSAGQAEKMQARCDGVIVEMAQRIIRNQLATAEIAQIGSHTDSELSAQV